MQQDVRFTIGELAEATGVSQRMIRFYIHGGVLAPPIGRARAAYYTTAHVAQLAHIADLRAQRVTLDEIRAQLAATTAAPPTPGDAWLRVALHDDLELHVRAEAPEQIRALVQRLRAVADEWFYGGEPE